MADTGIVIAIVAQVLQDKLSFVTSGISGLLRLGRLSGKLEAASFNHAAHGGAPPAVHTRARRRDPCLVEHRGDRVERFARSTHRDHAVRKLAIRRWKATGPTL